MFAVTTFIEKALTSEELKKSLSAVLGIDADKIVFEHDIEKWVSRNDIELVCTLYKSNAEYKLWGEIQAINGAIITESNEELLIKLSKELECKILEDDGTPCWYSWKCISPDGSIKEVNLNIDQYDEETDEKLI